MRCTSVADTLLVIQALVHSTLTVPQVLLAPPTPPLSTCLLGPWPERGTAETAQAAAAQTAAQPCTNLVLLAHGQQLVNVVRSTGSDRA